MCKEFELRPAVLGDSHQILRLQHRAFLELASEFYGKPKMQEAMQHVTLFTQDLVTEGHFFVLTEQAGRIVAAGGWSRVRPTYHTVVEGDHTAGCAEGIVRSVLVDPIHARQGLGRRIMEHVELDARRHGVELLTMTATLSGLPLYRSMNYRITAVEIAELPSGAKVDLRRMEKCLKRRRPAAA